MEISGLPSMDAMKLEKKKKKKKKKKTKTWLPIFFKDMHIFLSIFLFFNS
jgi:hypothetical protein